MKIAQVTTLLALLAVALGDVVPYRCSLKPHPGPCKGSFKKWFFNPNTKQCESFIYGGCKGQVPFDTEEECERTCEDPCKQLPDTGPCKAHFPSWFFNQKTRKCERFIWGGCNGSRPFTTLEACENKCGRKDKDPCELTLEDALPPPGTVTCQAFWTTWFYNEESGKCHKFEYSGCSPIAFASESKCLATCA